MKITKLGIVFEYYGDTIFIPWTMKFYFRSTLLDRIFKNFRNYWKERGIQEYKEILHFEKLQGFNWEEDILMSWLHTYLPKGYFVVLYDLDLSRKTADFWAKIPPEKRVHLTKDVITMKCDSEAQAMQIAKSIEYDMGKALVVMDNNIIYWNEDD